MPKFKAVQEASFYGTAWAQRSVDVVVAVRQCGMEVCEDGRRVGAWERWLCVLEGCPRAYSS
eukprot:565086-Rhodomonas_salina.1